MSDQITSQTSFLMIVYHRSVVVDLLVALFVGCAVGSIAFLYIKDFNVPQTPIAVKMWYNSTHVTMDVTGNIDFNSVNLRVKSQIGSARGRAIDIPNAVISPGKLHFSFVLLVNGVFDITVSIYDDIIFETEITVDDFPEDKTNTRFYCIGKDYVSRWCYARNLCVRNGMLHIISPLAFDFSREFVIPGARAPPYDVKDSRIKSIHLRYIETNFTAFSNTTAVIGNRYYNSGMMWHALMDGIFPIYWTMSTYASNITDNEWGHEENENYGIMIDKDAEFIMWDKFDIRDIIYLDALFHTMVKYDSSSLNRCYRNAILGLRKNERNPIDVKKNRSDLLLPYEIDPRGVRGLRSHMIRWAGGSVADHEPSMQHPLVLLITRDIQNLRRALLNPHDVINATRKMCPHCDIRETVLEDMTYEDQVLLTSKASVIMGVHGSGLTHVGWMKPSEKHTPTAMIELIPYKYTCRDWFEQASKIAGVEYYAVHTLDIEHSRWNTGHNSTKVHRCHTAEGECLRKRCHDFLRDQSIIVNIEQYVSITKPLFDRFVL